MPKEDLEKHFRFIEGEINRCSIDASDLLYDISICVQGIEQQVQPCHSRQIRALRHRATKLRSRLFLLIEEKRRLMNARLDCERNKAMKPKRRTHFDDDVPGSGGTFQNKTMHGMKARRNTIFRGRENTIGIGLHGSTLTHGQLQNK